MFIKDSDTGNGNLPPLSHPAYSPVAHVLPPFPLFPVTYILPPFPSLPLYIAPPALEIKAISTMPLTRVIFIVLLKCHCTIHV